jgi:hypothetical protein
LGKGIFMLLIDLLEAQTMSLLTFQNESHVKTARQLQKACAVVDERIDACQVLFYCSLIVRSRFLQGSFFHLVGESDATHSTDSSFVLSACPTVAFFSLAAQTSS